MTRTRPVSDTAARDLIRARLDINLLVEAGAGSGKTECLAQRMAAGVLEGRYKVEEMAAVTFTRKAAAELRGRFQLTLERARAAERNETKRQRAQQALRHLERLFAGTIHAFCAHLLRERPATT
jgi:ATP-dependent helicase/nuclease subunit A